MAQSWDLARWGRGRQRSSLALRQWTNQPYCDQLGAPGRTRILADCHHSTRALRSSHIPPHRSYTRRGWVFGKARCVPRARAQGTPTRHSRPMARPTYAIWIIDQTLFAARPEYAHCFTLRDERGRGLIDHGSIRLFELSKFAVGQVETEAERWLKFFKEGEWLDPEHLPDWMHPPDHEARHEHLERLFRERTRLPPLPVTPGSLAPATRHATGAG